MSARLLEGKVIFLTGGSTGIGWDCAPACAAAGACLAMVARRKDPVEQAAAKLGSDHLLHLSGGADLSYRAMKSTASGHIRLLSESVFA